MNLTLGKTFTDNIVIIADETGYDFIGRADFVAYPFLVQKKVTGDVAIPVSSTNRATDTQWAFTNLVDSVYDFTLMLIPIFSNAIGLYFPAYIKAGATMYDSSNNKLYKALVNVYPEGDGFISPSNNLTKWLEVNPAYPADLYNGDFLNDDGFAEGFSIKTITFIYYNNIINKYTELGKTFAQDSKCTNDYVETLRALRDKYEAIELASAASNYLGAQILIEASSNFMCNSVCCR